MKNQISGCKIRIYIGQKEYNLCHNSVFCFLLAVYQSTQIDTYYSGGKLAFFPQTEIGISFKFQVR